MGLPSVRTELALIVKIEFSTAGEKTIGTDGISPALSLGVRQNKFCCLTLSTIPGVINSIPVRKVSLITRTKSDETSLIPIFINSPVEAFS